MADSIFDAMSDDATLEDICKEMRNAESKEELFINQREIELNSAGEKIRRGNANREKSEDAKYDYPEYIENMNRILKKCE